MFALTSIYSHRSAGEGILHPPASPHIVVWDGTGRLGVCSIVLSLTKLQLVRPSSARTGRAPANRDGETGRGTRIRRKEDREIKTRK